MNSTATDRMTAKEKAMIITVLDIEFMNKSDGKMIAKIDDVLIGDSGGIHWCDWRSSIDVMSLLVKKCYMGTDAEMGTCWLTVSGANALRHIYAYSHFKFRNQRDAFERCMIRRDANRYSG